MYYKASGADLKHGPVTTDAENREKYQKQLGNKQSSSSFQCSEDAGVFRFHENTTCKVVLFGFIIVACAVFIGYSFQKEVFLFEVLHG